MTLENDIPPGKLSCCIPVYIKAWEDICNGRREHGGTKGAEHLVVDESPFTLVLYFLLLGNFEFNGQLLVFLLQTSKLSNPDTIRDELGKLFSRENQGAFKFEG